MGAINRLRLLSDRVGTLVPALVRDCFCTNAHAPRVAAVAEAHMLLICARAALTNPPQINILPKQPALNCFCSPIDFRTLSASCDVMYDYDHVYIAHNVTAFFVDHRLYVVTQTRSLLSRGCSL